MCLFSNVVMTWLDAVHAHLGLFVNQLAGAIYMCQTNPKPDKIVSTRPSQFYPPKPIPLAQANCTGTSQFKTAQSGNITKN